MMIDRRSFIIASAAVLLCGCNKPSVSSEDSITSSEDNAKETSEQIDGMERLGCYVLKTADYSYNGYTEHIEYTNDSEGNRISKTYTTSEGDASHNYYTNDSYGNRLEDSYQSDEKSYTEHFDIETTDSGLLFQSISDLYPDDVTQYEYYQDSRISRIAKYYPQKTQHLYEFDENGYLSRYACIDMASGETVSEEIYTYDFDQSSRNCTQYIENADGRQDSYTIEFDDDGNVARWDDWSFTYEYIEQPSPAVRATSGMKPVKFPWIAG